MVEKPYQRKRCTCLSEKCPSTAIFTPPKPLSTRSYLFSVRPQLTHCACSVYFGRQSCQTLFFSGLPAQILKGTQGSRQTIQLASWITHDSMFYYKNLNFLNFRCNRMKNRRGAYFGTTADKDRKTGKHLKCYASSYSNQDIINIKIWDVDHICKVCSTSSQHLQPKHLQDWALSLTIQNESVKDTLEQYKPILRSTVENMGLGLRRHYYCYCYYYLNHVAE